MARVVAGFLRQFSSAVIWSMMKTSDFPCATSRTHAAGLSKTSTRALLIFWPAKTCAVVRGGHRGNDEVDLAGLERGDEAGEGQVLDFDRPPEPLAERVCEIDADAGRLAAGVAHLEWRIGQLHADDELALRGGGEGG